MKKRTDMIHTFFIKIKVNYRGYIMKNRLLKTVLIIVTVGFVGTALLAADYSSMTINELVAIRGTLVNTTMEERLAFQDEWQKRLQVMTLEERQKYAGSPFGFSRGNGFGRKQSQEIGSRNGRRQSSNQGSGRGQGNGLGRK